MKRLLALALGLCLSASPALAVGIAQISGTGTGGAIANIGFSAGSSISLTTTASISAGNLIVAYVGATATAATCSDPVNGTYNAGQAIVIGGTTSIKILYVYTTGLLSNGSTITCSYTGSGGLEAGAAAFSGTDPSPFDSATLTSFAVGSSSGAATVGPTGTLNGPCGSANCEVLIGAVFRHAASTLTNDAAFTTIGNGNGSNLYAVGFKIVSATTAVSYVPSWASAAQWAGTLQGFKAASSATPVCNRSLLGVGC